MHVYVCVCVFTWVCATTRCAGLVQCRSCTYQQAAATYEFISTHVYPTISRVFLYCTDVQCSRKTRNVHGGGVQGKHLLQRQRSSVEERQKKPNSFQINPYELNPAYLTYPNRTHTDDSGMYLALIWACMHASVYICMCVCFFYYEWLIGCRFTSMKTVCIVQLCVCMSVLGLSAREMPMYHLSNKHTHTHTDKHKPILFSVSASINGISEMSSTCASLCN